MNKHFILLLLLLTSCSTQTVSLVGQDFFFNHTLWQLAGWLCFPRMMFWFFSVITGGFWFWLGVFLVPRIMVAFWATVYYWDSNPVLCLIAWVSALFGEILEKKVKVTYKGRPKS